MNKRPILGSLRYATSVRNWVVADEDFSTVFRGDGLSYPPTEVIK